MSKNVTVTLRGRLMYAKVLGDPVLNYEKDGKEWKFDLIPNNVKAVGKELAGYGIGDRLRSKKTKAGDPIHDGEEFMSFRQKEFTSTGKSNDPIEVVDILGKPWNDNTLIGNGSVADVRFAVVDYGPGKKQGVYPRKIRILEHIPYEGNKFEELSEDDEYFAKAAELAKAEDDQKQQEYAQFQKDFDLEDDLDDPLP